VIHDTDPALLQHRSVLQVRAIDPEVAREMRVECARRDISLSTLVSSMWEAYEQQQRDLRAEARASAGRKRRS
jgi:hypothetical protein